MNRVECGVVAVIGVDVSCLKHEPGSQMHYDAEVSPSLMALGLDDFALAGPVKLSVDLIYTGMTIVAQGMVEALLQVTCGRCLETFKTQLVAELSEVYYQAERAPAERGEDWVSFEGDVLDLEPEVLKTLMLALPLKVLCHEDCRGLCAGCGKNLNREACTCTEEKIDPRLAKLRELLDHK